ncbi:MAG: type III sulfide quinone reductase, selenoprotein subtype [Planctomycetota bacterium]|jgi:sulfide:quinone oxidoreductase
MKTIVIIGSGAAGTMLANQLRGKLPRDEWDVICIDRDPRHHYQPGYLKLPFGWIRKEQILKPKKDLLRPGIRLVVDSVTGIDPGQRSVRTGKGESFPYDFLVIASGCRIAPDEVDGLDTVWNKTAFDFYSLEGAAELGKALPGFEGGRLVINIAEVPFKCPIAPLEFAYMADDYLKQKGIRKKTEIVVSTPLPKILHMDTAADALEGLCKAKGIEVVTDFSVGEVMEGKIEEMGMQSRAIDFDLLVIVPPNLGDEVMEETGIDEGNAGYVPTDPHTLKARSHERIYVIGDAADLPTSKAGTVAHFCVPIVMENLLAEMEGREPSARFDGHTNCFIETGEKKAMMIDFAYDVDAMYGRFPTRFGPFSLLAESRVNYWGKLASRHLYWNRFLPGQFVPIPEKFSMKGKKA